MGKIKKPSLKQHQSIAFIMSPRLGDALLSLIVSHNLRLNGYKVVSFNNHLAALSHWFPNEDIRPYPDAATGKELLASFDLLVYMADYNILFESDQWHPHVIVLDDDPLYHRALSMVDIQVAVCKELFALPMIVRTNGLIAPADLQFRQYDNRIALHPMASVKDKLWLPKRFIALAQQLEKNGFIPTFIIAPEEQAAVPWIAAHGFALVTHQSLDLVARFIYESGWFIGNDSGVGHLASNLGIPTVTLLSRRSVRCRWRPNWAPGKALLPWLPLLIRPWKKNYWKYFISVERVLKAFTELRKDTQKKHFSRRNS